VIIVRLMRKIWPLAMLAALGCGTLRQPTTPKVYVDTNLTMAERKCVEYAAYQWDQQTEGLASVDLVFDEYDSHSQDSILEHLEDNKIQLWWNKGHQQFEDAKGPTVAVTNGQFVDGGVVINLSREHLKTDYWLCTSTVMHELGHAWGLDHTDSRKNVMFPHVSREPFTCLSQEDLDDYCGIYDCGTVHPKGCK